MTQKNPAEAVRRARRKISEEGRACGGQRRAHLLLGEPRGVGADAGDRAAHPGLVPPQELDALVDRIHNAEGEVRKTTGEMLTAARRIGEASAVFVGAGFDAAKEALAAHGAAKVYRK